MGALARNAAAESGAEITEKARRTYRDSFLKGHECALCKKKEIDPRLPLKERQRQADLLYRLHMSRLSSRSRRTRAWTKVGRALAEALEADQAEEAV